VAQAIFRAVSADLAPENAEKYPAIFIEDEGDHWLAYQNQAHPDPGMRGGGQLEMSIDKCTGAISQVGFER